MLQEVLACVLCMVAGLVSALPTELHRSYLLPSPRGFSSPQGLSQIFPPIRESSLPVFPAPRPLQQALTQPSDSQVPSVSLNLFLAPGQGSASRTDLDNSPRFSQTLDSDPNQLQELAPAPEQTPGQGLVPGRTAEASTVISDSGPSSARPTTGPASTLNRLYQAPSDQSLDSNIIPSPSQVVGSAVISAPGPGDRSPGSGSSLAPIRVFPASGGQSEQEPAATQTTAGDALFAARDGPRSPSSSGSGNGLRSPGSSQSGGARLAAENLSGADVDSLVASAQQLSVSGTLLDADQDITSGTSAMVSLVVNFCFFCKITELAPMNNGIFHNHVLIARIHCKVGLGRRLGFQIGHE